MKRLVLSLSLAIIVSGMLSVLITWVFPNTPAIVFGLIGYVCGLSIILWEETK